MDPKAHIKGLYDEAATLHKPVQALLAEFEGKEMPAEKQAELDTALTGVEAKIAEAKGLAEAQALQKASLTQEYLQLEAIKKWDGKLPQVVGGGTAPFINIPLK